MLKRNEGDLLCYKDYRDILFFSETSNITIVSNKDEPPKMINIFLNQ